MKFDKKFMVRNNRVILVSYNEEGSPFIKLRDPVTGRAHYTPIDPRCLGAVEGYPYAIKVETLAYEDLSKRTYEFVYLEESEAQDALKRYIVGEDFLDDERIVSVKGPFER